MTESTVVGIAILSLVAALLFLGAAIFLFSQLVKLAWEVRQDIAKRNDSLADNYQRMLDATHENCEKIIHHSCLSNQDHNEQILKNWDAVRAVLGAFANDIPKNDFPSLVERSQQNHVIRPTLQNGPSAPVMPPNAFTEEGLEMMATQHSGDLLNFTGKQFNGSQ